MKQKSFLRYYILFLVSIFGMAHCAKAQSNPPQKVNANYEFKGIRGDSSSVLPLHQSHDANYKAPGMEWFNGTLKKPFWSSDGNDSVTYGQVAPPNQSVQFNQSGQFAGTLFFTYDSIAHVMHVDSIHITRETYVEDTLTHIRQEFHLHNGASYFTTIDEDLHSVSDGQEDAVMGYGTYNFLSDGTRQNDTLPAMGWFQESHFHAAGLKQMELHLIMTDSNGNTHRIISVTPNEENGAGPMFMTISELELRSIRTDPTIDYFAVTDAGAMFTRGGANTFSMFDTIPGDGVFQIFCESGGQIRVAVSSTNPTTHLLFQADAFIQSSTDGNPLAMSTPATPFPVLINEAIGDNTDAQALNAIGNSSDILSLVLTNTNHSSGQTVVKLESQGTGDVLDFFRFNNTTTLHHNDWWMGQHVADTSFRIAFNDGMFFAVGNMMVMDGNHLNTAFGNNPTHANINSLIDMQSTTQGFLPPRMSTTERLAISLGTGDEGLHVYDLTLHEGFYWTGTAWHNY